MNSIDPWHTILTAPSGEVIYPQASYGNALYQEVPSWPHRGSGGPRRLLFDGAFMGSDTYVGGLFGSIGGALGGTLRKLGPVINTAAVTVATVYGGPAAGAAAAKFAPMITNLQANALDPKGNPKKKAAAQQELLRLQQQAATNPTTAQGFAAAAQAVKHTTLASHIKQTIQKAQAGNPDAQQNLQTFVQSAQQGDPAAASTLNSLAAAFTDTLQHSEEGAKLWEQITGRGPGTVSPMAAPTATAGWYDLVGQAVDDVRERARSAAATKPGAAAGVLITLDGRFQGRGFRTLDDAVTWLDRVARNHGSFTYAAAYEKDSEGRAYIQAEEIGTAQPAAQPAAAVSGWYNLFGG